MVLKAFLLIFLFTLELSAASAKKIVVTTPDAEPQLRSYRYASISYNWWQETLTLTNPDGTKYTLLANPNGPCVGIGYFSNKGSWNYSFNGCAFFAKTHVSIAQGSSTSYFQKSVPTYGLFFGPGIHYTPRGSQVSLGLLAQGYVRYANWTIPAQGWKVEPSLRFSGGLMTSAQWRRKRVVFEQQFGYIYDSGWLWGLGLNYIF